MLDDSTDTISNPLTARPSHPSLSLSLFFSLVFLLFSAAQPCVLVVLPFLFLSLSRTVA